MINENSIYSKLTPSAKEAVNELLDEYKTTLIETAHLKSKSRSTIDTDISILDVLNAKQSLEKGISEENDKLKRYKKRFFTLSMSGAAYTLAGIAFYIFQNFDTLSKDNIGLLIAFFGLVVMFFGYAVSHQFTYRFTEKKGIVDDYDLVRKWGTIEMLTLSVMKSKGLIDSHSNSINQVMKYLQLHFNESETLSIRELLSARNKVVHEGYRLSEDEKDRYNQTADQILYKLENPSLD